MSETIEILERLIAFPTIAGTPNLELIAFARARLEAAGAAVEIVPDRAGRSANLYATLGAADRAGVMLSGHSDVVPVEGQAWARDPFRLSAEAGRLYGRGTADMKGFVAAAIAAFERARPERLKAPLHLALSCDEEIGCVGVRSLLDALKGRPIAPALAIVGEPTSLGVATGHKGKLAARAVATGREAHSALAPFAVNAIHLAMDLIAEIRALQAEIMATGLRDDAYDAAMTTLHVGRVSGGVALNIVPNHAELEFEIRHLAGDDPDALLARLEAAAERIAARARETAPEAALSIEIVNRYPGLETPGDADAVAFVRALSGANQPMKVAFGTEGGLFAERLDIPVVICGPGSMAQGHKPDEYVTEEQLAACDAMLDRLIARLEAGL